MNYYNNLQKELLKKDFEEYSDNEIQDFLENICGVQKNISQGFNDEQKRIFAKTLYKERNFDAVKRNLIIDDILNN